MGKKALHERRRMGIYLSVFIALCIFSLFSGRLAPHDPEFVDLLSAKRAPGGEFLFGTD